MVNLETLAKALTALDATEGTLEPTWTSIQPYYEAFQLKHGFAATQPVYVGEMAPELAHVYGVLDAGEEFEAAVAEVAEEAAEPVQVNDDGSDIDEEEEELKRMIAEEEAAKVTQEADEEADADEETDADADDEEEETN